jgi:hypothetical protein
MVLGTTPIKVPVMTLAPWQLAHPLVMPLWLKAELLNFAPLATGRLRLLLAPTWQLSHPNVPIPMWLLGGATMATCMFWLYLAALALLWHCAQLALVDGALAWMLVTVGVDRKSPWHDEQLALAATGMWMLGREGEPNSTVLPWQLEQSPVLGCVVSFTKKVPALLCGRVWKPLKGAAVVMGYESMLIHTLLVSWHDAHPLLTPAWIMAGVGAGVLKLLPGALLVATPGTSVVGVLAKWQLSHLVEVGRCEFAPTGDVAGMTTILVMP